MYRPENGENFGLALIFRYLGIAFKLITWQFFAQFQKERYPSAQETFSYKCNTRKLGSDLVSIYKLGVFEKSVVLNAVFLKNAAFFSSQTTVAMKKKMRLPLIL